MNPINMYIVYVGAALPQICMVLIHSEIKLGALSLERSPIQSLSMGAALSV